MNIERKKPTVAEYLTQQIDLCGKSQREIATEAGYENANIITMFKQGLTKVPLNMAGPLAKALSVDPVHFLRLLLNEYAPEMLTAIEDVLQTTILTKNERELIEAYRNATNGVPASAVICDARDVIALVMV